MRKKTMKKLEKKNWRQNEEKRLQKTHESHEWT